MELVATPKNPIPLGASVGVLKASGKTKLRYAHWRSALKQRYGTVCIFPGRTEFIEKYFEVVGELRRRGFAVAALDWRGQGGSSRPFRDGLKGHVKNFKQYEEDLSVFMNEVVLPDCPPPYYALAHSMGGTVLLSAATQKGCWFSRMVMTAPMVKLVGIPVSQDTLSRLATISCWCGFGPNCIPGGMKEYESSQVFEKNPLTSDRERFLRNLSVLTAAPELSVGPPTIGWLRGALEAMAAIANYRFPPNMRVPVLMLAAGEDRIVSSKAIEDLALYLKVGTYILIHGAQHEIMQERDSIREQFWAAFDAFIPGAVPSRLGERAIT